jgi:hypothetical protein
VSLPMAFRRSWASSASPAQLCPHLKGHSSEARQLITVLWAVSVCGPIHEPEAVYLGPLVRNELSASVKQKVRSPTVVLVKLASSTRQGFRWF